VIGRDDEIRPRDPDPTAPHQKNNRADRRTRCGKTAIVEGLAQRIINEEVPETLKGKRVLSLDMAALLARQVSRRIRGTAQVVLKELSRKKAAPIVFIDELHTMVGAGKARAHGRGNMLKPALGRGELHCVGATTLDEYRNTSEKDAALERRFQKGAGRRTVG